MLYDGSVIIEGTHGVISADLHDGWNCYWLIHLSPFLMTLLAGVSCSSYQRVILALAALFIFSLQIQYRKSGGMYSTIMHNNVNEHFYTVGSKCH